MDLGQFALWLVLILAVAVPVLLVVLTQREKRAHKGTQLRNALPRKGDAQSGNATARNTTSLAAQTRAPNGFGPAQPAFNSESREHERIDQIIDALIRDLNPSPPGPLRWSSDNYPHELGSALTEAVRYKRSGLFLASVEEYDRIIRSTGVLYTGVATTLYKPVAASGALGAAVRLLFAGHQFWETDAQSQAVKKEFGADRSWAEEYLGMLLTASASSQGLEEYLASLSGNVGYRMPRDYAGAVHEIQAL